MTDKIWAHHPGGVVAEVTPPLPEDWVPGETIFPSWAAADLTDVTALSPQPAVGWTFTLDDKGKPTFAAPPAPVIDLAALKARLKAQVDTDAEALRLKFITSGSGQAMEYQEAYAQAQVAMAATGAVKASDYPMLAATIGVDLDPETGKPATDVLGVARSVKAAYEAYLQVGAAIRGARLLAKAEIDAATDADLAQAVFAAIAWPASA